MKVLLRFRVEGAICIKHYSGCKNGNDPFTVPVGFLRHPGNASSIIRDRKERERLYSARASASLGRRQRLGRTSKPLA
jgi:hypothetical protein